HADYVWHNHRLDPSALRRQLYNYSKGHVAYHLTTLLRDRDVRALLTLAVRLPGGHVSRILARLFRRSAYPLWLVALRIAGHLSGPWAFLPSLPPVQP